MKKLIKFPISYSEKDKQEIRDSIFFYFDNVLPDHNGGILKIIFTDDISSVKKSKVLSENKIQEFGIAILNQDNYVIYINQKLSLENIIKTLFHELTHVEQHIKKRYQIVGNQIIWEKTVPFPLIDFEIDFERYENLPWEIDARKVENEIFTKWNTSKITVWDKVLILLGLK